VALYLYLIGGCADSRKLWHKAVPHDLELLHLCPTIRFGNRRLLHLLCYSDGLTFLNSIAVYECIYGKHRKA
jgi:hypothetical protein